MHRATPSHSSFRAYVAGGARATIPQVDDTKQMQESMGNFMANEARKAIEAPQNYGFTSVCMDADKDGMGKILACAESFVQFMGGNRSFPALGNMDDRRHRLKGLEKGDVALFRTVADKLQMHFSKDGGFMTGPRDKTLRMHLLDEDSQQQQQQQGGQQSVSATDAGSSGGGGGSGGQQQIPKGQKALYKDGLKSNRFMEVTKDKTRIGGDTTHMVLNDGNTYVHCQSSDKHVYLGAEAGKGKFDYVVTISGPCVNTKGKIG